MIIRPYSPSDAENTVKLWNASLKEDQINSENFYSRIIYDVNFDPELFLLAEENSNLIGFAYGTKRRVPDEIGGLQPKNTWIPAAGVAPDHRRKGVGTALVRTLEEKLKSQCAEIIDLGAYATNYFFPGVDEDNYKAGVEFFKSLGYGDQGTCSSMDICLRNYEYPEKYANRKAKLESDGYVFTPFKPELYLPAADFLRTHFPHWLPNVRKNVTEGIGEESVRLALAPGGRVVGFAMRAMDGTPGRFGPFGVAPDQQGTGLGGILFHELVSDMVKRRIFYTWFLWTGGRNLEIYATWGMKIYRTYRMMRRSVK